MKKTLFLICLFVILFYNQSHAILIASEDFDYKNGSLNGDNGGFGWGDSWKVWFGSTVVNNGDAIVADNSWTYRKLKSAEIINAGQIWLSFTAQEINPVNTFAGLSLFNGFNEQGFYGDPYAWGKTWGLQPTGLPNGSQISNSELPASKKSLLVGRYDVNHGHGTMTLWDNPTSLNEDAAIAHGTFNGLLMFDTVRLSTGDGVMTFDDIKIGTESSDVFTKVNISPEPNIIFLFLMCIITLVIHKLYKWYKC